MDEVILQKKTKICGGGGEEGPYLLAALLDYGECSYFSVVVRLL